MRTIAASGVKSEKMPRQPVVSTRSPPTTKPSAPPPAAAAVQALIAVLCARPVGQLVREQGQGRWCDYRASYPLHGTPEE